LHPTASHPRAVIALQLLQIREARLLNLDSFVFEERQIPLKPTCGVMITMNPGYAGMPSKYRI
jgi:dynein heavy chain